MSFASRQTLQGDLLPVNLLPVNLLPVNPHKQTPAL